MTDLSISTSAPFDPSNPSRYIYVAGYRYQIAPSSLPRPPLAQTAKLILNWALTSTARTAKNIMYALLAPPADPSVPATLTALANEVMTAWVTGAINNQISNQWSLMSVVARDNSGGTNQSVSTHAPVSGMNVALPYAPGTAVCLSWQIAAVYKGGKPRTYLPGVPISATPTQGDSVLVPSYASSLASNAQLFLNTFNSSSVGGTAPTLGTISYYTGHALRPTPFFRAFGTCHVHERLDSQRRRSGKESAFGVYP